MKIFLKNFTKKIKVFFLPSVLACSLYYISTHYDCFGLETSKEKQPKIIEKSNKAYFEISEYGNFEDFKTSSEKNKFFEDFGLMFPILEDEKNVLFGDVKASVIGNSNIQNFSAGLGLRFQPENKKEFIVGLNSYVDFFTSKIGKNFVQFGLGGEILHDKFELRANLYKNISDDYFKTIWSNVPKDPKINQVEIEKGKMFVKFELPNDPKIVISENKLFNEIDYELGYALNKNITVYGGGFIAWNNNFDEKFMGSRLKLKFSTKLNEKTELYGKFETKTNTVNSLSSSKTDIKASGHIRFEIQSNSQKIKLKKLKSKNIPEFNKANNSENKKNNQITIKATSGKNLLQKPVFRRHHIELQEKKTIQIFKNQKFQVNSIGGQVFDYIGNIKTEFKQNDIPTFSENSLFFFNLNENTESPVNINEPLTFDAKTTFLGDTSRCDPISKLCTVGQNGETLFSISTDLGNFDIPIKTNGGKAQTINLGQNAELNFNNDFTDIGINYESSDPKLSKALTFIPMNISGSGDTLISNSKRDRQKLNIFKTGGTFTVLNSEFNNSIINIPKKFSTALSIDQNVILNKIDIQNSKFNINAGEQTTLIDTIFAPTNKDNFIIKGNTFKGNEADIKIRNNKDLNIVQNFVSNNILNDLKNIEFVEPIIPPILNSNSTNGTITFNHQTVYPSIKIFDRAAPGNIIKNLSSIENVFPDYNNSEILINNFKSNTIQFVDTNTKTLQKESIELLGNLNFQDDTYIFGRGSNDQAPGNATNSDSNLGITYKIFTNQANVAADTVNIAAVTEKLPFLKPNIKILNSSKLNFRNNDQIIGLNFDLSQNSSSDVFKIDEGITNVTFDKNNFINWSGKGTEGNLVNLINIIDNTNNRNAGHKFSNNNFSFSNSAKFANIIKYENNTDYFFTIKGDQLQKSLDLQNNIFSSNANLSNNNNFIYIKPKDLAGGVPKLITFDIRKSLTDFYSKSNTFNNISANSKNSKIIDFYSIGIIEYLKDKPFTAYFQFDPLTITENISFNFLNKNKDIKNSSGTILFNSDFSIADIVTKNVPSPAPNVPIANIINAFSENSPSVTNGTSSFTINNRWISPTSGASSTLTIPNSNPAVTNLSDGTTTGLSFITNARFSDWKTFDRIINVKLQNNDNLNQKLQQARQGLDTSKSYLFLIESINNPINVNLSQEDGSNTTFLKDNEYLVGPDYKFWISTQNEDSTSPIILNDIVNFDSDNFNSDKLTINVNAKTEAGKGFKPVYTMKNNIGLIGLKFNLSVDNENNLLNIQRPEDILGGISFLPKAIDYYYPKKNNTFFSQVEGNSSNPSGKIVIQDNKFTLNSGRNDKDYINIFEFRNYPNSQSISSNYRNYNLDAKYKIYNNEFNLNKSKTRVLSSLYSFVPLINNRLNFKDDASNINLINIPNHSAIPDDLTNTGAKIQFSLYNSSNNLLKIPNNNFFSDNGTSLIFNDIDKLKSKNISLINIENPRFGASINQPYFNGSSLNELSIDTLKFMQFPIEGISLNGTANNSIEQNKIHIIGNYQSTPTTRSSGSIQTKPTIALSGSSTMLQFPDQIILASTNEKQPEIFISTTQTIKNGASASSPVISEFPLSYSFHSIDTSLDITPTLPTNGGITSDSFDFNFDDDPNHTIIFFGKSNILSGIDIKSTKVYKFDNNCNSTGDNIFITTCSDCLNPKECSTGDSGCSTCTKNDPMTINSASGISGVIFKFQDDDATSKIQNSNINLNLGNSVELSDHIDKNHFKNSSININGNTIIPKKAENKLSSKKTNDNNIVKLDYSKNIISQINDSKDNSIIILEKDLILNHDSVLNLKNKSFISKSVLKNEKFKDIQKNFTDNSENLLETQNPKIIIKDDTEEKIFINHPIFNINENTVISGFNFEINASLLDRFDQNSNSLFKFENSSSDNSSKNLKISENNFNLNLSGGLKLFDSKSISPNNLRDNNFEGKFSENSFFFDFDKKNISNLEEDYLKFNLVNKNKIEDCDLKFNYSDIKDKISNTIIFDNKEYQNISNISSNSTDFENLGEKFKKTLFFSENDLILKNKTINLGNGSNAIVSSDKNKENKLNLKIKPSKKLDSNKLNIELELKPASIKLISEDNEYEKNSPIIKGENYNLYDLNFEIYENDIENKKYFSLLEGKPGKLLNNVFTLNNRNRKIEESIIKDDKEIFQKFKILDENSKFNSGKDFLNNFLIIK